MTTVDNTFPVLYILMRTDLDSMNSGKAMAQASHASNAFVKAVTPDMTKVIIKVDHLFNKWSAETGQGFGTVLVLGVNEEEMRTAIAAADKVGFVSGIVNDPTYPILIPVELGKNLIQMDCHNQFTVGEHYNYITIPEDTCAYVFGDKNDPLLGAIVGNFDLHP